MPKSKINLDIYPDILEYTEEMKKEIKSSRNEFIEKAIKQYDPHRKEVSPQFAAWMERKG